MTARIKLRIRPTPDGKYAVQQKFRAHSRIYWETIATFDTREECMAEYGGYHCLQ